MTVWLALAGMFVLTLSLRSSYLMLPENVQLPPLLRRALRFVPAAVLTAIWAPELLMQHGTLHIATDNARLLAGAVAIAVAWRWRITFATIIAGMMALHVFDWLL